jgi:hypothetical protein
MRGEGGSVTTPITKRGSTGTAKAIAQTPTFPTQSKKEGLGTHDWCRVKIISRSQPLSSENSPVQCTSYLAFRVHSDYYGRPHLTESARKGSTTIETLSQLSLEFIMSDCMNLGTG